MATGSTSQNNQKPFYSAGYENPKEFHYICSIRNLSSILEHGLLCHNKINELGIQHTDLSNRKVREKRKFVRPNMHKSAGEDTRNLHDYVNLYINAINRTLYKNYKADKEICILRINPKIRNKRSCIVADRNAATHHAKFEEAKNFTFGKDFSHILHHNESFMDEHKLKAIYGIKIEQRLANQIRQAELLYPSKISSKHIIGIYVPNHDVKKKVIKILKSQKKLIIINRKILILKQRKKLILKHQRKLIFKIKKKLSLKNQNKLILENKKKLTKTSTYLKKITEILNNPEKITIHPLMHFLNI